MDHHKLVIMGVDPGNAITGYGFLTFCDGKSDPQGFHYGVITTTSDSTAENRLKIIYDNLDLLIKCYRPKEMAVEELFFNKNAKTALSVGEARGVVLLCAASNNVPIFSYTPLQIKQSIVGYGRATKGQILYMVKQILGCQEPISPDDAADALAVAICHSFRIKSSGT